MRVTLANIKALKKATTNNLEKRILEYVEERFDDYDNKKAIFTDVLEHGCQSGIVSDLVYYSDTVKFYETYKEEINELFYEVISNSGLTPEELFEDFDHADPLCLYHYNQNLLAWFGFEETMRRIYEDNFR